MKTKYQFTTQKQLRKEFHQRFESLNHRLGNDCMAFRGNFRVFIGVLGREGKISSKLAQRGTL